MQKRHVVAAGVAVLTAGGGSGLAIGGTQGEQLAFAPKTVTVGEDAGEAVVTVRRSHCNTPGFYAVYDAPGPADDKGTAQLDADYQGAHGQHRFEYCDDGSTRERTATIPTVDDDKPEEPETIELGLSAYPTSSDEVPMPEIDPRGV